MRIAITIVTLLALLAAAGLANSEADKEPTLYTAYNIWRASKMKCINFKQGVDIIPAGTKVRDVKIKQQDPFPPYLVFTTVADGRTYKIGFTQRWHPKKSIKDYRQMMFTTQNFEALTEGLSDIEIDAIKKGVLVNGMSKRAVLVCYGPPPEHYTPDQDAKTWYYWANRKDKIAIKFDRHHKTVIGELSSQVGIKKATEQKAKVTAQPQEKPKLASIPKEVTITRVSLRKKPIEISNQTRITDMLVEHDFFDRSRNPHGSFENVLIDNNDGTVTDKATGLMWQKSGSSGSLDNRGAKEYVKRLKRKRFAGHSNWRMPTVEELSSLIKKAKRNGVHIDPVFDNKQIRGWTVDQCDPNYERQSGAWIVSFKHGEVRKAMWMRSAKDKIYGHDINDTNYVKAVRSVK